VLTSCTGRTIYKKPDDLIPKGEMVDLWVDIMIANGANGVKNEKSHRKVNYMRFLYEKHQIDSARFMNSNVYYISKIEEYEKMFEEVEIKLNHIKTIYDPFPDEEDMDAELPKKKRDSIKKREKIKREKLGPFLKEENNN